MSATGKQHIMIVAGEASGDMQAAHLIEEIRKLDSNIEFSGLGGPAMKAQGVVIYEDLTRIAVVGFIEVVKHYREFKKVFNLFLQKAKEIRPAAVILVDYPGFNLRLAKKLKESGIKVIYYISPQVWAWKESRVAAVKKFTDKMLVLFQFESHFYARHNLKVHFVGHPLIDLISSQVGNNREKQQSFSFAPSAAKPLTIGVLPGSRENEIHTLLPVMLDAAFLLSKDLPAVQFLLLKAPTISQALLEKFVKNSPVPVTIVQKNIYQKIAQCDLCLVASGTATLEVAILNKPMVIVYKTSFLTWLLAKLLIKIPFIGLVNVVAGKKIVPECIQFEATGGHIAKELRMMCQNPAKLAEIKAELEKVRLSLGEPGAGERAAREILKTI